MAIKSQSNIRLYRGTTAELAASLTIFEANSIILDLTLNTFKFGNGINKYSELPETTITGI